MKDFNQEYFFILKQAGDSRLPSLDADEDTVNRRYRSDQIPMGSAPLIFRDGFLELKRERGIKPYHTPPDVLFDGSNPVVKDNIREALLNLNIPNIVINESIYIDPDETWHENLWFIGFRQDFDCWDREKSEVLGGYNPEDEEYGSFEVRRYVLNNALLAQTPLQERLLFKMGQTFSGNITVHASVAKYFLGKSGVVVLPVADYGDRSKPINYIL